MQRFRSRAPAGVLLPLFVLALATLGAAGVSTASADTSDASALQVDNCEVGPQSNFVPGEILMMLKPGADIGPILEEEGEPPGAAELIFDEDFAELIFDEEWYVVSVPAGEELAKCRAYLMHPEVLIAEPNFLRAPDDPAPTPYPQSTITVRFVNGGQPVTVILASSARSADGVDCRLARPDALSKVSQFSMAWPHPLTSAPECRKGPPTLVRFEFLVVTLANDEALRLSVEENWEGNDLVLDLNIPDRFVFAPAPNPNGLPSGGGPPEGGSSPAVILIIAVAALLAVSAAVAVSQRPKPSTTPDNSQRGR